MSFKIFFINLGEVLVALLFSTISFWLGALAIYWNSDNYDYIQSLSATYRNGELWIFATAFIAPCVWMLAKDEAGFRPPKARQGVITLITLLLIVCAFGFASSKTSVFLGVKIDKAIEFSVIFAILATLARLAAHFLIVFREKIDPSAIMKMDQDNFMRAYEKRRG
ncbi:hypothetical protein [Nitrogeniibacter aestuarii]|uniref:hypothetical protein n=1 Tax=Nitrogeniibacter aestuarii TaxID=2815343 RepID=UPI001D1081D2|nr:hypothetical protein [Nitrogeniibacter aestuarii]